MLIERSADRARGLSTIGQLARGLGYTYALIAAIWAVICISGIQWSQQNDTVGVPVHWALAAICAVVALVGLGSWRRLSVWRDRPSWLGMAIGVTLAAASIPALLPFTIHPDLTSETCVAITDAWHPVVAKPTATEIAVFQQVFTMPTRAQVHDAASLHAWLTQKNALRATPAFQAANRYEAWTFGPGSCVPQARSDLSVSGLLLLGGATGIAGGLARRRRTVRNPVASD